MKYSDKKCKLVKPNERIISVPLQACSGPEGSSKLRFPECKAVPLQAWSGPEGSRKLRFPECKAVPLQVWSGPEGSRKLRLPHFMSW